MGISAVLVVALSGAARCSDADLTYKPRDGRNEGLLGPNFAANVGLTLVSATMSDGQPLAIVPNSKVAGLAFLIPVDVSPDKVNVRVTGRVSDQGYVADNFQPTEPWKSGALAPLTWPTEILTNDAVQITSTAKLNFLVTLDGSAAPQKDERIAPVRLGEALLGDFDFRLCAGEGEELGEIEHMVVGADEGVIQPETDDPSRSDGDCFDIMVPASSISASGATLKVSFVDQNSHAPGNISVTF